MSTEELTPEILMEWGKNFAEAYLASLSPEERLAGLGREEILSTITPQELLSVFSVEELENYLQKIKDK